MKFWKKYKKSIFILLFAACMISAVIAIPGALADDSASQPFSMEASFDGTKLKADGGNTFTASWSGGKSKTAEIVVNRNTSVAVDSSKKYVLSMKVPDTLYFNGLPDASDINGLEKVYMVQNTVPKVYTSGGGQADLSGFSKYSGEIRMELNPSVETITIPDIGISYNQTLVGYNGGAQTISDALQIELISVDNSTSLDGTIAGNDKTSISSLGVDSVSISSGSLSGGGLKNTMSTKGYSGDNGVNEQDVTLGKSDTIAYSCGTAGQAYQVYKSLKVVYHCPYITIDGQKHYLDFSSSDSVLTTNKQGNQTGYRMSGNVVYDADAHTLTYSFKDIYLGSHTRLFYTPVFSWPDELTGIDVPDGKLKVEGSNWEITEQKCYTGVDSTLRSSFAPSRFAYYIPDKVDVSMVSSAEAPSESQIAKREIYQGITKESGIAGTLGFFDVHNDGALDSPKLDVSFDFSTEEGCDAVYYVTQVNLPVYGNSSGTDVSYTLMNDKKEEKSGTLHYSNANSFYCYASDLRKDCGADSTYYIKSLSYSTSLQKGRKYHEETAHLYRNRVTDLGLFFGYIEGKIGEYAAAKMTIKSADGSSAITADGKTELFSTEKSKISDQDYIGYGLGGISIGGADSASITAGNSINLKFGGSVSTEEYQFNGNHLVNGYHVLRDGIFYVCLPDGVSIPGTEQVTVLVGNSRKVPVTQVQKLDGASCTVDGKSGSWWMIEAPNVNAANNTSLSIDVQLATDEKMQGVAWEFKNCVVIRAKGQSISWNAADSKNSTYNNSSDLTKLSSASLSSLGKYLESNGETTGLGMNVYNSSITTKLNIARAEAKLDVETSLKTSEGSSKGTSVTISDPDTQVEYEVSVTSSAGGVADDFEYYIPVVMKSSTIDADALVAKNEFGLLLQDELDITHVTTGTERNPFKVYYTTDAGLTSSNIRGDSVNWEESVSDYSKVTAVKIATVGEDYVDIGDTFSFTASMKYDDSAKDFKSMAGSQVEWRSFGRYTYTRNNVSTTNTYPSGRNDVTVRYINDMTSQQIEAVLDTAAASNTIDVAKAMGQSFAKKQTLSIKKVTASTGTQLITSSPDKLTGSAANSQFRVAFNINNIDSGSTVLQESGTEKSWDIDAGKGITLQANVTFSKALTDVTTPRYVDVTLGNDYVDIVCRIQLVRKVAAADAKDSGLAPGENFIVPNVESSCTISRNSAFTALYVIKNFVPGNYSAQYISFKDSSNAAVKLPKGATVTMMEISDSNAVGSYWYYTADGSSGSVDLKSFRHMSGSDSYTYDTSATEGKTLKYMFVVDFGNADAAVGTYKLDFCGTDENKAEKVFSSLPVSLAKETTYAISISSSGMKATAGYTVTQTSTNDSYIEGKTLAIVVTPKSSLPADAYLKVGSDRIDRNLSGNFIIPVGTIQSGEKSLSMGSDMMPDAAASYDFTGSLYLVDSDVSSAPMAGDKVGTAQSFSLTKSRTVRPALKITGDRVATAAEWSKGQDMTFRVNDIPEGGSVTVTPYSGLTGGQRVTDLLSSVAGLFDLQNGVGTYDRSRTDTGKLRLSGTASPGTYRLVFEVKDADGKTVQNAPYYVIVKDK